MKRRLTALLFAAALALPTLAAEEEPQIGYRILSGYIERKQIEGDRGRRGAGTFFTATGGILLAGAATTYFAGDQIGESLFDGPMDPTIRNNLSLGLGIGGAATLALGAGILASKPHDWNLEYAEVFEESDAQIREALAVAAIKDLAIKGKKTRMVSAVTNLAVPLIYGAVRASINLSDRKDWYDGISEGLTWSAWNVASGIGSLFGTSEEERLYEKYQAGRDALYGDRR